MRGKRSWLPLPRPGSPGRELARVYRRAERWKACVEVLKEAVEKATWATAEAKVPVLLEMVELYRDRLKLDVMVVEAYNRILTLQPNNVEVMDALAAQYEVIPRWPELIACCAEGGHRRLGPGEDRAGTSRWQTCTWRSSRTRPRPSRRSKRSSN